MSLSYVLTPREAGDFVHKKRTAGGTGRLRRHESPNIPGPIGHNGGEGIVRPEGIMQKVLHPRPVSGLGCGTGAKRRTRNRTSPSSKRADALGLDPAELVE